jgi:hypothetical protein
LGIAALWDSTDAKAQSREILKPTGIHFLRAKNTISRIANRTSTFNPMIKGMYCDSLD